MSETGGIEIEQSMLAKTLTKEKPKAAVGEAKLINLQVPAIYDVIPQLEGYDPAKLGEYTKSGEGFNVWVSDEKGRKVALIQTIGKDYDPKKREAGFYEEEDSGDHIVLRDPTDKHEVGRYWKPEEEKEEYETVVEDGKTYQIVDNQKVLKIEGAANLVYFDAEIPQALATAQKIDILSDYMYEIEHSTGEGFENAAIRGELEYIVERTSRGNPDENDILKAYITNRAKLDRVARAWNVARLAKNDKDAITKFWTARANFWNPGVKNALENGVPSVTTPVPAIPGLLAAEIQIRQLILPKDNTILNSPQVPYFQANETQRRATVRAALTPMGLTPQQAAVAVLIAERILTVDINTRQTFGYRSEAERQGQYFMPNAPTPKDQQEAAKKVAGNLGGFLGNIFGLGKK